MEYRKCVKLDRSSKQLGDSEISEYLSSVSEWDFLHVDGVQRIRRVFNFSSYSDAFSFVCAISSAAVLEDHHPRLILEYFSVTVEWWTHSVSGLHENDFIMAVKTDIAYGRFSSG
jgi:4a-hydroxytetrahydrobiopterin dehydratase